MPTDEVHEVAEQLAALLVFLQRPSVRLQLAAFAAALATAWLLTDGVQRLTRGRVQARVRRWLGADRRRVADRTLTLLATVEMPIASGIAVYLAGLVLRAAGRPSGLLRETAYVVWLLLGYRVLVAVLGLWVGSETIRPYRRRLLAPLFVLVAALRVVGLLVDLDSIGSFRLFTVSETPILLGAAFSTAVALYFIFSVAWAGQRILQGAILPRTNAEPGTMNAVLTIGRYVVIIVAASFALGALGFDTSTVAFISGGLTVAIGFGSQQVFANLVSGILLLFDQSLRPGDVISVGGEVGVVESLSIRSTTMRTPDNVAVVLPNQSFISSPIRNLSKNAGLLRVQLPVAVAFEGDPRRARDVLEATARRHPSVLRTPPARAHFTGFGLLPSGRRRATCQLAVWVSAPLRAQEITSDLYLALHDALAEEEMELV